MFKPIASTLCLGLLAACNSTPPQTLLALSRFDPMTADLSQLGARIEHPAAIEIRSGDARIMLVARRDDGVTLEDALPLTATSRSAVAPDRVQATYAVTPADLEEIKRFRGRVTEWKAQGHAVSGAITVSAKGCATGKLPEGKLPASIWLRLSDETGFLPVRRDVDLRALAAGAQEGDSLDSCADS